MLIDVCLPSTTGGKNAGDLPLLRMVIFYYLEARIDLLPPDSQDIDLLLPGG